MSEIYTPNIVELLHILYKLITSVRFELNKALRYKMAFLMQTVAAPLG